MKRLQSAVFLLLCFALGVGLALAYLHLRHAARAAPDSTMTTGIGDAPPLRGFSLPSPADAALLPAYPPLHATAVAVHDSGDAGALAEFVRQAHALQLKVILLPPAKMSVVNPYLRPLPQIAREARTAGVDVLCLSWLNADPDPDFWLPRIAQVRKAFSGKLLLAAQPDLLPGIEFFEQVDLIGAIGPFDLPLAAPTTGHAITLHDVRAAWASYLDSLESLSFRYDRRLVLLNIQVPPLSSLPPAAASSLSTTARVGMGDDVDSRFPALTYEALVTETKGRTGTEGLFMNWVPSGNTSAHDPSAVNHDPELLRRIADLWLPTAATGAAPADHDDADDADTDP